MIACDDHALATEIARQLVGIEGLRVHDNKAKTNMVCLSTTEGGDAALHQWCAAKCLLFDGHNQARLVVHKQINVERINRAAKLIRSYFGA